MVLKASMPMSFTHLYNKQESDIIVSDETLLDTVEVVKDNINKKPYKVAKILDVEVDTLRRYLTEASNQGLCEKGLWKKLKSDQPVSLKHNEQSPEDLIQGELDKYSVSQNTQKDIDDIKKVKLAFGDLHIGDEDVMWSSIKSTIDNAIEYIKGKDYEYMEVINVGDTVSGTAIFRGQKARNIIGKPHWQTMGGAIVQKDMFDKVLDKTSIEDYEVHVVKGNHDQSGRSKDTNLAYYLVKEMQSIGIRNVHYEGDSYLSDNIYAVHGFGNSDYKPESNKFARTFQKKLHNLNNRLDRHIDRVLHGHTHWSSPPFPYTINCYFDSLGGYQRNARADLGRLQRPAGFHVYEKKQETWERRPSWQPKLIEPDRDVFENEANDKLLEFKNILRVGQLLLRAYETAEDVEEDKKASLEQLIQEKTPDIIT